MSSKTADDSSLIMVSLLSLFPGFALTRKFDNLLGEQFFCLLVLHPLHHTAMAKPKHFLALNRQVLLVLDLVVTVLFNDDFVAQRQDANRN